MNHIDAFRDAIAATGLTPPDDISDDGKRHRFSSSGKPRDESGWYILHGDDRPAGAFGCWRSQMSVSWKHSAPGRAFSDEERAAWRARMKAIEKERADEAAAAATSARERSARMWGEAVEGAAHPYLDRKHIKLLGARVLGDELLIPMKSSAKEIVGLQRIFPDGTKRFLKGTPKQGAYCVLGTPSRKGPVVFCEGYATGASIHMATGMCVVVAFDCGNIAPVVEKIRAAMPDAEFIIAADDDFKTEGNPGLTAAEEAAYQHDARVVAPGWRGDRGTGTDFNDLHAAEGLEAVRACFFDRTPDDSSRRAVKLDSDGGEFVPNNTSSNAGDAPFASGVAVQSTSAPVILPEPGADVILPAIVDQLAPNCSDDDLAARHIDRMDSNTLWCEMWGRWLVWNGTRWLHDETNLVLDVVRQTCRQTANEVLSNPEVDPSKRQRQADKIASYRTITNVERLARTYRSAATHPDEWDVDKWSLNTPGGVVSLRTGEMRPHSREDRFTKITTVAPGGECPTWLSFLERATGGNKELQSFLQRMCGYALTGEVREHALFFVYGTGGNGKGTFLNTITSIMGDYQRVAGAETFTESHGDRHTTELARLQGARLVTAQETEEGKRWAESRIKSMTGGDPITARYMRKDDFTFMPQFKLVIVGNHKPSFRSVDDAIRRRLHLVPFTAVIPAEEKDELLPEKLKREASGILQWMIEGCVAWDKNGLKPPAIVKESTEEYLGAEDSLQQWLDECCEMGPFFSSSKELFASWVGWCEQSGDFTGTMKRLIAKLENRGIKTGQKFQGVRGCSGIQVKNNDSSPY